MKKFISNALLLVLLVSVILYIYCGWLKIQYTTVAFVVVFLILYMLAMVVGAFGVSRLEGYIKKLVHDEITNSDSKKPLLFSVLAMFPAYFCIALVSLIPITSYEIWLITVFPCIAIISIPASSVYGEYSLVASKKAVFWWIQALIVVLLMLVSQLLVWYLI
ncbi:MAG: hypothetical protein E7589_06820 [Ruminococcaceae bacterium]|nr:hypothetical protein [Oscillospiraceae bacterium]